jgi:hypothetical protein
MRTLRPCDQANWTRLPASILTQRQYRKNIQQYRLLLVLLIGAALTSDRATGQEIEPPVLIGVGKGQKQMEQLIHLYAIDAKIVNTAAKIGTPDLGRAFVFFTTHANCCKPAEKVSTNCWYCWGLDSINGWREVSKLLDISRPIEVSKDDPQFAEFQKRMAK